jgi:hypothetical protein
VCPQQFVPVERQREFVEVELRRRSRRGLIHDTAMQIPLPQDFSQEVHNRLQAI